MKSLASALLAFGVAIATPFAAAPPADLTVTVTTSARALQPGELVLVTIKTTAPVDELQVRGLDRDVTPFRVGPTEWRALVGIDLDAKPGRHALSIVTGPSTADRFRHNLTVLPKTFRTRTLSVDAAFVNPPPETLARIADDTARLNRAWASSWPAPLWSGSFVKPVSEPANSVFGTRSVYNGEPRSPHSGADFSSPAGTPVHAPNAGRVVLAADLYFTGNTVLVDHGAGLFSLFAHLRTIAVHESDIVSTGMILGEVGATGRVTGAHLHWAVRANGARVDPLSLLAVLGTKSSR